MDTFIKRLKSEIVNCEKSQIEICKELKFTKQTLSNWKSGYSTPNYYDLIKLAQYFNVSTDYLLGLTDDPTPNWVSDTAYVPPQSPQQTHYISTIAKGGERINKALSEEEYLTIRKELEKDN